MLVMQSYDEKTNGYTDLQRFSNILPVFLICAQ